MIITTATRTEALPIIENFQLKQTKKKPFSLYENDIIKLLITGIGKINAAAALSYQLAMDCEPVVNVGFAAGERIGELYEIKKSIDVATGKLFLLPTLTKLPHINCFTVDRPQTQTLRGLADMEASALVQTARLYKAPINIFKIVSDTFEPHNFDPNLLEPHIPTLLNIIDRLNSQKFQRLLDKITPKKGLQ